MKYLLSTVTVALASLAMAQWVAPILPEEEESFKVIIEDVPEEVQDLTSPQQIAPVRPAILEAESPAVEQEMVVVEERDPVPNCAHDLTPPQGYSQEVLMLQIFLDRHNFSGGVIDGVWGTSSREAMRAWQTMEGVRRTQWVDVPLYAKIAQMEEPLIPYTITAEDADLVTGPMPPTWAERAKLKLMGYETLGACIAERFHTSERTLRRLNPGIVNWPDDLHVGMTLTVPNVRMAALEQPAQLVIALEECVLAGYDKNGVMRLRFPCSIARKRAHLPSTGEVVVKNMAPAPNYTYDPANYGQDPSVGKMVVPAGPRNPVGSRWIGLNLPGYGIHGTPKPNSVGRAESRGCFRLTNWNAEKLFELVKPGTPVLIVKSLCDVPAPKAPAAVADPVEEEAADPVAEETAPAEAEAAPAEEVPVLKEAEPRVIYAPVTLKPQKVTVTTLQGTPVEMEKDEVSLESPSDEE